MHALNSQDWTNVLFSIDAQQAYIYASFHLEITRLYIAWFPVAYFKQGTNVLFSIDAKQAYIYASFHLEITRLYIAWFPVAYFKQGYKNRKPWLTKALKINKYEELSERYKNSENIEIQKK